MWNDWNSYTLMVISNLEYSMEAFHKVKHTHYHMTHQFLTQEKQKLLFVQNLHVNIYSGFIIISKNLERMQITFNGEWITNVWYNYTMEY